MGLFDFFRSSIDSMSHEEIKLHYQRELEKSFDRTAKQAYKRSPTKGDPFAGIYIMHAMGTLNQTLKESLISSKDKLGLSVIEIEELVDNAKKLTLCIYSLTQRQLACQKIGRHQCQT